MESVAEHRVQIAGHMTRALEVDGDGPGIVLLHGWSDSADTWRPLLAELAARGRRAIAVDLPGFGDATPLQPGAVLPQLDAFANEVALSWAGTDPIVVAGTSLGGCLALRLAEHPGELRLVGVVPVAPDGLELPSWFDPIEEDPMVRRLLSIPVAVPGEIVRRGQAAAYRKFALSHPTETQKAVVEAFSRDGETRADVAALLESGRALAPELSSRAVRPDRHPLPRPARVGRARSDAAAHRRPDGARRAPDHPGRADRGRRSAPAARRHPPARRAADAVRHLARTLAPPPARLGSLAMRRTLLLTIAFVLALVPSAGAAEPRIGLGVAAGGTDVSGLTLAEAEAKLAAANAPLAGRQISAQVAGRTFIVTPEKHLDFAFDARKSARRAYNAGLQPHTTPINVELYVKYSSKKLVSLGRGRSATPSPLRRATRA